MLDLRNEVIGFVAEKLGLEEAQVEETSYFIADLGLNSLASLELICDLEERFDVRIPDETIPTLLQVGDLISFIARNGIRKAANA